MTLPDQLDALDRLCAEKIMGWGAGAFRDWFDSLKEDAARVMHQSEWQPTRRIDQAWELIQTMNVPFTLSGVGFNRNHFYFEMNIGARNVAHTAPTAPLVIVLAALKAKGVEIG